jgi:hypothetical protein
MNKIIFNTPGEYNFIVPENTNFVSVLCIGGQGSKIYGKGRIGGLRYLDYIPVNVGNIIKCYVGNASDTEYGEISNFGDHVEGASGGSGADCCIPTGVGGIYGIEYGNILQSIDNLSDIIIYGGRGGPLHGAIEIRINSIFTN